MTLSLGMGLGITSQRGDNLLNDYLVGGVAPVFVDDFVESFYYNTTSGAFSDLNTLTRASVGSYIDSAGVLQSADVDAARFTYNPTTLARLGLMVEAEVINKARYSSEYDQSAHVKSETTIDANATASPDGTTNADALVESSNNAQHQTYQSINLSAIGTTFTWSAYFKANGRSFFSMYPQSGVSAAASFNLITKVSTDSVTTNLVDHGVEDAGSGFVRCWIAFTMTGSTLYTVNYLRTADNKGASEIYTGDGASGAYLYGIQVEDVLVPTSYIPTTTAAVTRSADVVVTTGITGTLDVRTTYHDDTVQDDLAETVTEGYWPTLTDTTVKSIIMYPSGTL